MNSQALPSFWELYYKLPAEVRQRVSRAYRIWQDNPHTPGLRFKSSE